MSKVTRDDVARRAGVSTATVSYVLNGGPKPVAAETRERVLRVIEELDYVPNEFARSLKGAGNKTIGYLVPNIRNPFFAEMTSSFNQALRKRGYQLLLADLDDDPGLEREYLELFRKKDVNGVVAWQISPSSNLVQFLSSKKIPFAVIATRNPGISSAVIDESGAASIVVAHLKALGHRNIVYVGPGDEQYFPQSRLPFVLKALAAAGLPAGREVLFDTALSGGWRGAAQRLASVPDGPTAVIAHNDALAIQLIAHLIDLGFDIPRDLSVVGYDNLDISKYTKVPLTSVNYSKEMLGQAAIDLVLNQIEGKKPEREIVEIPVELVVRKSTARPIHGS